MEVGNSSYTPFLFKIMSMIKCDMLEVVVMFTIDGKTRNSGVLEDQQMENEFPLETSAKPQFISQNLGNNIFATLFVQLTTLRKWHYCVSHKLGGPPLNNKKPYIDVSVHNC